MTSGELGYAVRQALNNFDKWNNVTSFVSRGDPYYYEIQGIIEDAVNIGAKIACEGINTDLSTIVGEGGSS